MKTRQTKTEVLPKKVNLNDMKSQVIALDHQSIAELTPDTQWAIACQNGDAKAFQKIVRAYQEKVRGLVYSVLSDSSILDDMVQEIFIKIYKSIDRFEHRSSLGTWIYRIALNHCRDEIRRRRIRRFFSLDKMEWEPQSEELHADGLMLQNERIELVRWGLDQLSESHRMIIMMKDFQDLSYEEIADVLQIELGTVKSRLNRARNALKNVIDPYWNANEQDVNN